MKERAARDREVLTAFLLAATPPGATVGLAAVVDLHASAMRAVNSLGPTHGDKDAFRLHIAHTQDRCQRQRPCG